MTRRWYRRVHQWLGLASAVVLVLVSVTGVVLHHPHWLRDDEPTAVLLASNSEGSLLRVSAGLLEISGDGGQTWRESPLDLVPSQPVRLMPSADGESMWLVGQDGLLVGDHRGMIWDLGLLPPLQGRRILDLSPATARQATLLVEGGAWTTADGGQTWETAWRTAANPSRWPGLVRALHTGHLGGDGLMLAYDLAAGAFVLLVITGVVLTLRPRRRAADRTKTSPHPPGS